MTKVARAWADDVGQSSSWLPSSACLYHACRHADPAGHGRRSRAAGAPLPCSVRRTLRCCAACMLHGMLWAHEKAAAGNRIALVPRNCLQICTDGVTWRGVDPLPGCFIVNIGDMLCRHAAYAAMMYCVCGAMPPSLYHSCHL